MNISYNKGRNKILVSEGSLNMKEINDDNNIYDRSSFERIETKNMEDIKTCIEDEK